MKVKGVWKFLHRAVDKAGATVDLLPTAKRACKAVSSFSAQGAEAAITYTYKDYDRQERCQYGGNRKLQF